MSSFVQKLKKIIIETSQNQNENEIIVYLDMDGVLADFHGMKVKIINELYRDDFLKIVEKSNLNEKEKQTFLDELSLSGRDSSLLDSKGNYKVSKTKIKSAESLFWKIINKINFFENLEPLHDNQLIKKISGLKSQYNFKLGILGSTGSQESYHNFKQQKINWLKYQEIYNLLDEKYVKFVPGKKYKSNFAYYNTILIDDTPINCQNFRNSGGNSILFLNINDTLNKLENILKEITLHHSHQKANS